MSGHDWQPGDLAMRRHWGPDEIRSMFVGDCRNSKHDRGPHWHHMSGGWDSSDGASTYRPLVVIDAEDAEAAQTLLRAYLTGAGGLCDHPHPPHFVKAMQAALREFAAPEPPKPTEPLGLGAVVEDAAGVLWTRTEHKPNMTGTIWVSAFHVTQADRSLMRAWSDIDVVRVLSKGVTE